MKFTIPDIHHIRLQFVSKLFLGKIYFIVIIKLKYIIPKTNFETNVVNVR